jgi:hypothetical protein
MAWFKALGERMGKLPLVRCDKSVEMLSEVFR